MLSRIFPFIEWFKEYHKSDLRSDFVSGVTVALVLIPQSMAYAQLAGLPAYYGLYAAFLPPMIAALFGSSRQLATGPVAVVSLMTAAALAPLATAGGKTFIAYAVLLALLVGIFQFAIGLLRLGAVVNFLSHPVVNGFTNAAALIIASSQLSKLFGVYVDSAEHHYETVYRVIVAAISYTHWPTLALGILAIAIMVVLKYLNPKIPYVLVAVVITTLISWSTGYENNFKADISMFNSSGVKTLITEFNETIHEIERLSEDRTGINKQIIEAEEKKGAHSIDVMKLHHELSLLNLELNELEEKCQLYRVQMRSLHFEKVENSGTNPIFFMRSKVPQGLKSDGRRWRIKVSNVPLDESAIKLVGGGDVVAKIPKGLPTIGLPGVDYNIALRLFSVAAIISLLGFMEAISIAKAMAAKTGQKLDPNQELIGQGLANIIGSFGQSYPVSGSFSRSAVNIQSGAVSGLSSVFTSCVVVITLLFFTPLLYHLPQAVLAAIIMMAVIGLVNIAGVVHAWQVQKTDGIVAIISFMSTLAFAPHLDKGIMIGVVLSLILYLYRNMKPTVAILSKHPDGSFRNAERWNLKQCRYLTAIRFNGSLFFANTSYLEDKILERVASMPDLKHVLIVANGMNEIDASGEEMLSLIVGRLHEAGYDVSFSGLNDAILDSIRRTHLYEKIGEQNMYRNVQSALEKIHAKAHEQSTEKECPLLTVCL
ncbi:MAG: DNA repair protein [Candidatus Schekmanbacteria bacterium RBG_13_48_7]|uniref:DNA repair protein n=1 Tax=Candidatus Schekmanbacteria bacterium RBG_13_48_7 TaxID=1817878 RepID=A0A1F7S2N9_9BACT|nr:MAG: DNA repair protein [Candidatus Schekmanbacteria bacterium RBG_13_48_7]